MAAKFRIGRHLKRAILKIDGTHVVTFQYGQEKLAKDVCDLLNGEAYNRISELENELLQMASSTRLTEKTLRQEIQELEKENIELRNSAEVGSNMYGNLLNQKSEIHKKLIDAEKENQRLRDEVKYTDGIAEKKQNEKLRTEIEQLESQLKLSEDLLDMAVKEWRIKNDFNRCRMFQACLTEYKKIRYPSKDQKPHQ